MKIIERLKDKFRHKKEPILFTSITCLTTLGIPEKFYTIKDGKIKFNKFNEAEANEFIKLGNHNAIIEAIKNSCFLEGNTIHGFRKILKRGNHEEIMAFLKHFNHMHFDPEEADLLIKYGNHDEIMLAIKNKAFEKKYGIFHSCVYGLIPLLKRGNHDEIMAFLQSFKDSSLDQEEADLLIERGNHEEIMLAIKNKAFEKKTELFVSCVYGLIPLLERGNHDEIMAFLQRFSSAYFDRDEALLLVRRGNRDEITLAIKNKNFRNLRHIMSYKKLSAEIIKKKLWVFSSSLKLTMIL